MPLLLRKLIFLLINNSDTENSQEEDGLAPSVKRVAKSFNKVEFQEILTNLHI